MERQFYCESELKFKPSPNKLTLLDLLEPKKKKKKKK